MSIEGFEDFMETTCSDAADVCAASRATKFSLAANYDPELVPALAAYPIDEVYGKFATESSGAENPC